MMKKSHIICFFSLVLALVLSFSLCIPALAAGGFSDVPESHWAYSDIMACAERGIVTGYEDGTFRPGDEVTGIQFIVMLTRTFYSSQVEAARETETSRWYAPNMKVATDVGMLKYGSNLTLKVDDSAMNRYDMAFVLASTLSANGKTATMKERNTAKTSIKDAGSIPSDRTVQVYTAYHFGIITGMSDGSFSGDNSMNRAQACTVIMRMMTLLGGEAPAQPEQPEQPDQPDQQTSGKLLNGEDATVENVVAMLKEIEEKYPTGTPWGPMGTPNNNWYVAPYAYAGTGDVAANNKTICGGRVDMSLCCGGWAHQVSDLIFGISGAPCREVYSVKDARPGDIVYQIRTKDNTVSHVAVITNIQYIDGKWLASTCDGNLNAEVCWNWDAEGGLGYYGMQSKSGSLQFRVFTRYPE